jgi:hypothetical protein
LDKKIICGVYFIISSHRKSQKEGLFLVVALYSSNIFNDSLGPEQNETGKGGGFSVNNIIDAAIDSS